jgi:hypothetical protein
LTGNIIFVSIYIPLFSILSTIKNNFPLQGSLYLENKYISPGADPGFQVRGAHLKKLRRAEGGAKILGIFRVKIHDFTPKKQITESPSNYKNKTVVSKLHCMSNL